jgi:hypothetical protein
MNPEKNNGDFVPGKRKDTIKTQVIMENERKNL